MARVRGREEEGKGKGRRGSNSVTVDKNETKSDYVAGVTVLMTA